jgi:hypothetical protein
MRSVGAALVAGFAALAFCLVAPAAAAPGPPEAGAVILDVRGCDPRVAADTRRIVGIELGVLLLPPTAPPERRAAADRLGVACEAGAAELVATGGPARVMVRRRLPLVELPDDVAARALALAGIEMLAALSPVVRARVAARALEPPAATAIVTPSSERSIAPAPPVRLSILGGVRTFSSGASLVAWVASVDLERPLFGVWGLAGNVEVAAGGASSALGDAHEQLASLGGCWEAGVRGAHWAGAVGLGGRVGLARFAGTPPPGSGVVGSAVVRPWAGPAVSVRARLGGKSIALAFLGEVGFALRGAQGLSGGDVLVAASGGWLSAAMGVGF